MGPRCLMTQRRLEAAGGEEAVLGRFADHYEVCLACRVEAVRYRRLGRELRALAAHEEAAPPELVVSVSRRLAGPYLIAGVEQRPSVAVGRAAAFVGAIAAAAGTAIVVHAMRTRSAA